MLPQPPTSARSSLPCEGKSDAPHSSSSIWPEEMESRLCQYLSVQRKAATHITAIRKDRHLLQDLCCLGVEVGSNELNGFLAVLCLLVEEVCEYYCSSVSSNSDVPESPLQVVREAQLHTILDYILQLWTLKKEINDIFCGILEKKTSSIAAEDRRERICFIFVKEIEMLAAWLGFQLQFLSSIHQLVEPWRAKPTETSKVVFDRYLSLIQTLYLGLGDLIRYKEIYAPRSKPSPDFQFAWQYYYRAFLASTPSGAVHRRFATLAKAEGLKFEFLYNLFHACSSRLAPFNARDILLETLEKQRSMAKQVPDSHALSNLSTDEHFDRFSIHLFSCVSIIFSRVGADAFAQHLENVRRHLSAMLQILVNSTKKRVTNPPISIAEYFVLENSLDMARLNSFENRVTSAFTVTLATLNEVLQKSNVIAILSEEFKFYNADQESPEEVDPEALHMLVLRRLNVLRSVPGLMDAVRLVCGFIVCLTGGTGLGLYTSNLDDAKIFREVSRFRITMQSITIFFEWFQHNEIYHIIPLLDSSLWRQLEASLQSYFTVSCGFCSGMSFNLSDNFILPEDLALRGFSVMHDSIKCRLSTTNDSYWCSADVLFPASNVDEELHKNVFSKASSCSPYSAYETLQVRDARCRYVMKLLSRSYVQLPGRCTALCYEHNDKILMRTTVISSEENQISIGFTNTFRPVFMSQKKLLTDSSSSLLKLLDCTVNMLTSSSTAAILPKSKPIGNRAIALPGFIKESVTSDFPDISSMKQDEENKAGVEGPGNVDEVGAATAADVIVAEDESGEQVEVARATDRLSDDVVINVISDKIGGVLRVDIAMQDTASKSSREIKKFKKNKTASEKRMQSGALYSVMFPWQQVAVDLKPSAIAHRELPVIVLDVPNIAMRHGLNSKFSCLGIRIVFDFFLHVGHRVVGFLPASFFLSLFNIFIYNFFKIHISRIIILIWGALEI